jgi:hypothetical protein
LPSSESGWKWALCWANRRWRRRRRRRRRRWRERRRRN